jgi:hypothetical protein
MKPVKASNREAVQITPGLTRLERAQEVDDVLPLPSLQPIETVVDFGLRTIWRMVRRSGKFR